MRPRLTILRGCVFALALLAAGSVARAQDSDIDKARQHYQKAQNAFDLGRWDDAIAEYEAAYSFRADPVFLYNTAQAYRRKGDTKHALDLYKNFLIKSPNSPQRPDIEDRIRQLQKQIDKEDRGKKRGPDESEASTKPADTAPPAVPPPPPLPTVAPAQQPAPQPAPVALPSPAANPTVGATAASVPVAPPPAVAPVAPSQDLSMQNQPSQMRGNRPLRIAGLAVGGAGALALVGGVVMGARAKSLSDEVSSDARKQPVGTFDRSKYDSGKRAETLEWVGYGVGAAALLGGAVLYWYGMVGQGPATSANLAWTVAPSIGAKSVGGQMSMSF